MRTRGGGLSSVWFFVTIAILVFCGVILFMYVQMKENFSNDIPRLEYYFMENCGHCKQFNSTWDQLGNELRKNNIAITTKKIDLNSKEGSTNADKYNISGAPTILLFVNQKKFEYNDVRNVNSILNFIKSTISTL